MSSKVSKAVREIVCDYIMECSALYDFNGSEAIERLLSVDGKSVKSVKSVNSVSWPVPFNSKCVNVECCQGLRYNSGLFTQCKNKKEGEEYCKECNEESKKNESGMPDCGNISERMKCGLMEFKDGKGRKPVAFLSVLKKKKIGVEKVREDAKAMNIAIDEEHFNEVRKEKVIKEKVTKEKKEKSGRPKKEKKEVVSNGVVDLFASLVEEEVVNEVVLAAEEVIVEEKPKKKVASSEEKEKKAAEKAEKAAAEKAAREEKRAAEKAAKEAAKEAAKAEKEAAKASKKKGTKEVAAAVKVVVEEEKPKPKVTVTRFEHEGKKYLKSTENILYDPDTKEELGIWCEESKTITALPEDEDEEIEEEEYEGEDD
jgi:hypothetical protein